jgi:hypothetical protein
VAGSGQCVHDLSYFPDGVILSAFVPPPAAFRAPESGTAHRFKLLTGLLAFGIALLGAGFSPGWLLVLLLALVTVHAVYGAYLWFTYVVNDHPTVSGEFA